MGIDLKQKLLICIVIASAVVFGVSFARFEVGRKSVIKTISNDYYNNLPDNAPEGNPLEHIGDDFIVDIEGFESNLPLVVIHKNEELSNYKEHKEGAEVLADDVEPWTSGNITLYDTVDGRASLTNTPSLQSDITIKKRGRTSYYFDKSQYYIKLVNENGEENPHEVFGMPSDYEWVLNGSMADKSMIRNYIAYRTAAMIMEYSPRCCFCEMFTEDEGVYKYQGVYLMIESVKQGENRVNIDKSKTKNVYTSYMVRRDRYPLFDTPLDTYARVNGMDNEWIGIKYPSKKKQTEENIAYIENDFSNIEKIIYSDNFSQFKKYSECIDVNSFADYFIINEYFGNYDAGLHSTYMYKNSGDKLAIGPVWDFDQAMNNSRTEDANPNHLAMQEKAIYKQIFNDEKFVELIKKRYSIYRDQYLNDEYMFSMIDETVNYLSAAREREWYRWAEDYFPDDQNTQGKYILQPSIRNEIELNRMTTDYNQELYTIRTYLSIHGEKIQSELSVWEDYCEVSTGIASEMEVLLVVFLILFLVPSILINRK